MSMSVYLFVREHIAGISCNYSPVLRKRDDADENDDGESSRVAEFRVGAAVLKYRPDLMTSLEADAQMQRRSIQLQSTRAQRTNTHTHTHPFNGPFSGTTRVSRYQKGKTNLDFTGARGSKWQWHQLGHMQVCTLLQTDNHASTPPLSFLQAGCPSCHPTDSVKALTAQ